MSHISGLVVLTVNNILQYKSHSTSILDMNDNHCLVFGTNRIYHQSLKQTKKSQPQDKQIMLKTRLTEFQALSVDPRVGISWSASELSFVISFILLPFYVAQQPSLNISRCFLCCCISDVTYEI